MMQETLTAANGYAELDAWLKQAGVRSLLLVHDSSLPYLKISQSLDGLAERLGLRVTRFSGFQPNPLYESVAEGVRLFHEANGDAVLAVGGGSAMDVAKCIKLYATLDPARCYLEQELAPNGIPLIAVPTTAGTGSEATRYAVIYKDGAKQSVTSESCIPAAVLYDESVLDTLPAYQKKATLLDALCHATEAYWSVNSTEESRAYSTEAIKAILTNAEAYLAGDHATHGAMLRAATTAGRAINITQTTAGHAMCYKLTSLYGIAHGHAAALCVKALWPWMLEHTDRCADPRGENHVREAFAGLAAAYGCGTPEEAAARFAAFVDGLALPAPEAKEGDVAVLAGSVNPMRLKNNPIALDAESTEQLYREILHL